MNTQDTQPPAERDNTIIRLLCELRSEIGDLRREVADLKTQHDDIETQQRRLTRE